MTENILGRKLEDIDIEFLQSYFSKEQEESDVVEFKSYFEKNQSNHKIKEDAILKTICAFLNSSGGVVIWGAPVGEKVEGRTVFVGELSPVEHRYEKDSFISKVSTHTIPLPSNIKFRRLNVEPDKYVYVIEVLESISKPHQFDNRYFMRLDGQTKTAPHHYIEALFKQIRFPQIEGYVKIKSLKQRVLNSSQGGRTKSSTIYDLELTIFIYNFSAFQNEENVSFILTCSSGVIEMLGRPGVSMSRDRHKVRQENAVLILYFGAPYSTDLSIHFEEEEIVGSNFIAEVLLVFGGKFSPQKASLYKIDLSKYEQYANLNDLIIHIEENKTHFERQQALGESKEDYLKGILGR